MFNVVRQLNTFQGSFMAITRKIGQKLVLNSVINLLFLTTPTTNLVTKFELNRLRDAICVAHVYKIVYILLYIHN